MYKKINVYVNGIYKFSSNKYKNCQDLKKFLGSKGFVYYQGINGNIMLPLYKEKITVSYK